MSDVQVKCIAIVVSKGTHPFPATAIPQLGSHQGGRAE